MTTTMTLGPARPSKPGVPRVRRGAAFMLLATLVPLLAGSSWLRLEHAVPRRVATPTRVGTTGVDANRAIETVTHHLSRDPAHPATLVATDDNYRARFDGTGFA